MLNEDTVNIDNMTVDDSIAVQEYAVNLRPRSPTIEQALATYAPATTPHILQQQQNENNVINVSLLNLSSRVTIAVGKYPNNPTLQDFGALREWMYINTNKCAPIDVCQSLIRIYSNRQDEFDLHTAFNVFLICAETYQTSGHNFQACQYIYEVEIIAKELNNSTATINALEMGDRDQRQAKLKDVKMKIKFQNDLQSELLEDPRPRSSNLTEDDFFRQLCVENPTSEQCRAIWREIVLQCVRNPEIAIVGARWLLSYAHRLESHTIQHANSLYVAVNLFLFDSGADFFRKYPDIDLFQILDDIGRCFDLYGYQSKQFSPIQKMAHVWGAAAMAFYLKSDEYRYLVCACMMRVSLESLAIIFQSSGIEALLILARKHAPSFACMMGHDPHVKLISPHCINYFRQQLEMTETCIRYSSEIVDQFVAECFNIDVTDHLL